MRDSPRRRETLDPQRNFSLSTEERVRAVAAGPPAFMRRLRAIEDLEEGIVRVLVEQLLRGDGHAAGGSPEDHARATAPVHAIARLNDLIARHNRWYPIEANLRMQPPDGELVDRTGQPWRAMPTRTVDELVARALSRVAGSTAAR